LVGATSTRDGYYAVERGPSWTARLKSSVQEARPNHRERILVLSLVVVVLRRCCGIMKRVHFIGIALIVVVGLAAWSSSALIPINSQPIKVGIEVLSTSQRNQNDPQCARIVAVATTIHAVSIVCRYSSGAGRSLQGDQWFLLEAKRELAARRSMRQSVVWRRMQWEHGHELVRCSTRG